MFRLLLSVNMALSFCPDGTAGRGGIAMERTIETIRKDIQKLYDTGAQIHMNVTMTHPKITVRNAPATIKGVYPNIFQIEENENGYIRRHSLQYNDILIGRVEILELQEFTE